VRWNKLTRCKEEKAVESVRNTEGGTKVGMGTPTVCGLLHSSREGEQDPMEGARCSWAAAGKAGWNSEESQSSGEEDSHSRAREGQHGQEYREDGKRHGGRS
jgi:hypothetical protein